MGDYSSLGYDVDCYCVAPVTVGAHATVSQYSFLCTASHDIRDRHMRLTSAPIEIGEAAWICAGVFVAPGVNVGPGAVAGARAVVVRDVAAWMVVAGNPAVEIKRRELADGPCSPEACAMSQSPATPGSNDGGLLSAAAARCYVALSKALAPLPNFRGKVRAGLAVASLAGTAGASYFHRGRFLPALEIPDAARPSMLARTHRVADGRLQYEIPEFLARLHPGRGYTLDIGASIGLIGVPLAMVLRRARLPGRRARLVRRTDCEQLPVTAAQHRVESA